MNIRNIDFRHVWSDICDRARRDPKATLVRASRIAAGIVIIAMASTVAMYFHGIPFVQYAFESSDPDAEQWPPATGKITASYFSFAGTLDVGANQYGEGCPWVVWVPIEHIDGLNQKLPFSILSRAENLFRTEPAIDTRQRL